MINFFMQCGKSIKTCINYIRKNGGILQKFAVNQSDDKGILHKYGLFIYLLPLWLGKAAKSAPLLS
ncbi:hypothetical protein [Flavobacterium chungbukense]|uniref:hypothetical protein n=1 Tax=Flavobacterium chungbukense TaxID=877464 RepID=UPI0031DC7D57